MDKIKNMRKLVAAFVGLAALFTANFTDMVSSEVVFGMPLDMVTNMVISVLTMVGVYEASNDPVEEPEAA